jgi:hypothetical protein
VAEPIVVNTGPLVSFARIGCLDVIGRLPYEFLCPAEVWQELDEGLASGYPRAAPRLPWARRTARGQGSERPAAPTPTASAVRVRETRVAPMLVR